MAYKYTDAIATIKEYLQLQPNEYEVIDNTKGRGLIYTLKGEPMVIFVYPISCKDNNRQNFFDTRDSGANERRTAWKYAQDNDLKYFCLGVNSEQTRYKDYILSLECPEERISSISFRSDGSGGTGTQVNIPADYIPSKPFERILTPLKFDISFIRKEIIKDYLQHFDNRPYTRHDELIAIQTDDESLNTVEAIGKKLKEMYDSAGEGRQVASIIICGIKFGKQIKENDLKPSAIVEAAGLQSSYYSELTKGLKIYECLADGSFGIGFGKSFREEPLNYHTGIQTGYPVNRIVFGAPGTGKSYSIEKDRKDILQDGAIGAYERVTFHPDYTYSQFVGAYKPVTDSDDNIRYQFVPGPFMRLYVKSLKNAKTDTPEPHVLIIEEINRADVAAVFGDVFQLLDRDEKNVSEYPIQATQDIRDYLSKELGGKPNDYSEIRIPDNMLIWATMNSADQGVFPMDTAFKRRWDFTYLGINTGEEKIKGKFVTLGKGEHEKDIEWNELRKAINNVLLNDCKVNEDKLMGAFFISMKNMPEGRDIDPDLFKRVFKNKVLMYLFEDAAKQKRPTLFDGCHTKNLYSAICDEFDDKGVDIFNDSVRSRFPRVRSEEEQE